MNGKVVAMYICPQAGQPMQQVQEVKALAGKGLKGDRYCMGEGSFNFKGKNSSWWWLKRWFQWCFKVKRQVTLISAVSFRGTGFEFGESRRNIVTEDVELMFLIGKEFYVGAARFRGVKYCDPCNRPSKLCNKEKSFKEAFFDRGGLIAEIIEGGIIKEGDIIIPPYKGY